MPSLKEYRNRIASVTSTRKITSAMKMVAASKLSRAQAKAEKSRPYADRVSRILAGLIHDIPEDKKNIPLISGTGRKDIYLILVFTSDNGLCAGFNNSVIKLASTTIKKLISEGKKVKVISIGRKGSDVLKRDFSGNLIASYNDFGRRNLAFKDASEISHKILSMFKGEEFDVCKVIYNKFISVIAQTPVTAQLIPFDMKSNLYEFEVGGDVIYKSSHIFEPAKEKILEDILPLNFSLQVFKAMLENSAGEKAARMTSMDNATNNADDMIDSLTLNYNRARQSYITKELIEIISGAEAL